MRQLLFVPALLLLLALVVGCKKECPICDQYIDAVKKCVKTKAPPAARLEKERKTCLGFCKKKMAAPPGEKRAWISRMFMAKQACVIDYENLGCERFLKCIAAVDKKQNARTK